MTSGFFYFLIYSLMIQAGPHTRSGADYNIVETWALDSIGCHLPDGSIIASPKTQAYGVLARRRYVFYKNGWFEIRTSFPLGCTVHQEGYYSFVDSKFVIDVMEVKQEGGALLDCPEVAQEKGQFKMTYQIFDDQLYIYGDPAGGRSHCDEGLPVQIFDYIRPTD